MSSKTYVLNDIYEYGDRPLGNGAFGTVWSARCTDGRRVAIKEIDKSALVDPKDQEHLIQEIKLQFCLRHPNLVRLYEIYDGPTSFFLIQELVPGDDLVKVLAGHADRQQPIPEAVARDYFHQIASAVAYMHQLGVCHRDLKLDNCLLANEQGQTVVKICDFGLAAQFKTDEEQSTAKNTTTCGSELYMAPEISSGEYDGSLVDVWALGVILYALITLNFPFDHPNKNELRALIQSARVDYPSWMGSEVKDLLMKIFVPNPEERITIEGILEHPWLQGLPAIGGDPPQSGDSIIVIHLDDEPAVGKLLPSDVFNLIGAAGPLRLEHEIWDELPAESSRSMLIQQRKSVVCNVLSGFLSQIGAEVEKEALEWRVTASPPEGDAIMFALSFFSMDERTLVCVDKTDANLDNLDQLASEIRAQFPE